jgi:hypothetical protein
MGRKKYLSQGEKMFEMNRRDINDMKRLLGNEPLVRHIHFVQDGH